ncbi:MAG: hypothetical protein ACTSU5_01355 [Promethearchaeota archaeon]
MIFMFIFIGYRILSRNRALLNFQFALFFLVSGSSLIINVIYMFTSGGTYIINDDVYIVLNNLVNICVNSAWIFLYCFIMMVKKSEVEFTKKKQLLYILIFLALLSVLLFIPGGVTPKSYNLSSEPVTYRRPLWSMTYFTYGIIVFLGLAVVALFQAIKVYGKFQDPSVKRKFLLFIIGMVMLTFLVSNNYLTNAEILGESYRSLSSYLTILIIIPSNIFIYYGVGKRID